MLLENLYRVLYENQEVTLQDIREQKTLWHGLVRNIPVEYLSWTVVGVISCAINLNASVIRIDLN
jgi:hypothetical protein|nr:MAG TPA: hypothetical protein [Caudoviricetes sp.]